MKKLLTLLAMLVCAFTATMAQTTYTYSLNGADDQSSPGYFSNVGKHSFNKFIVNSMRNIRGRHKSVANTCWNNGKYVLLAKIKKDEKQFTYINIGHDAGHTPARFVWR